MEIKILVIDDERELVKAVEVRLKASGYQMVSAYDGPEGLEKARQVIPDIILLDIVMPTMNGYEVCMELMKDPTTKDIPIVVISASQQSELETKCRELGITHFITKPFETTDLTNMIYEIIKEKE